MAEQPADDEGLERATTRLVRALAARGATFNIEAPAAESRGPRLLHRPLGVHAHGSLGRGVTAWTRVVWAMAATVVIAVGVGAWWYRSPSHLYQGQPTEYVTSRGQRLSVVLIDGSRITLAPASHLTVPQDYATGHRSVHLTGEGMFTVVHDDAHPFSVTTRELVIRDVGTVFDVRAYTDDPESQVTVASGRVDLQVGQSTQEGNTAVLGVGDLATVQNGVLNLAHHADLAANTAWTQGGLVFQGTPFRDVVRALARTFDLQITVADTALANRTVTATIGNEPVDEVLEAVTRVIGASVERHGRAVTVRRRAAAGLPASQAAPLLKTAQSNTRTTH